MSLKNNYEAWELYFRGTRITKKKCLRKFYDFIYFDGLSDKMFRKRSKRNKVKTTIKCVYNLFLKSNEEDKNKLYLYFNMIDCLLNSDEVTERGKAQLLFFIKRKMKFMKFKIWKKLIPELNEPLQIIYLGQYKTNVWKPPRKKNSKNKRKVLTCSYLNRFLVDKTFIEHHLRDIYAYEELEKIEEDLEEEIGVINTLASNSNYQFYKKHKNYIDNFRVMAKENKDILNVEKVLK